MDVEKEVSKEKHFPTQSSSQENIMFYTIPVENENLKIEEEE